MSASRAFKPTYVPPGVVLPTRQVEIPIASVPAIAGLIGKRHDRDCHGAETVSPLRQLFVTRNRDDTYALVSDPLALELDLRGVTAKYIVAIEIESGPEYSRDLELLRTHCVYVDSTRCSMSRTEFLDALFDGTLDPISRKFVSQRKLDIRGHHASCLLIGDARIPRATWYRFRSERVKNAQRDRTRPSARRSAHRTLPLPSRGNGLDRRRYGRRENGETQFSTDKTESPLQQDFFSDEAE